jgi:sec-independent protein translocase protein TatC
MFLAFGCAFQVPIFTLVLLKTGAVSIEQMKSKRPYIIVGAFILGMVLTPPDVISQVLLALPIWLLFECGMLLYRKK